MTWNTVGAVAPTALVDTRLQLHWASQVVASVGFTFAPPQPDWSHTSLQWNEKKGMLVGTTVGTSGFRAGIDLTAFEIVAISESEQSRFGLDERTLDEAYDWILRESVGVDPSRSPATMVRPEHVMPSHPVGSGAIFNAPKQNRQELSLWFSNASHLLTKVSRAQSNASPVRCWPHHFDIATLITIDTDLDAEEARSVGVGMSPGDDGTSEPYFYVTPWPYPDPDNLPDLPEGRWNTSGWVGAMLIGTELAANNESGAQLRSATMFAEAAVAACRRLLE